MPTAVPIAKAYANPFLVRTASPILARNTFNALGLGLLSTTSSKFLGLKNCFCYTG